MKAVLLGLFGVVEVMSQGLLPDVQDERRHSTD
jgi:hypothetical protein